MSQRNPVCVKCKSTSSLMWHKTSTGSIICLDCQKSEKANSNSSSPQSSRSTPSSHSEVSHNKSSESPGPTTRRSTRSREKAIKAKQQLTIGQDDTPAPSPVVQNSTVEVPESCPSVSVSEGKDVDKSSIAQERDCTSPAPLIARGQADEWKRGRRSLSLKLYQPVKLPVAQPSIVTSDSVIHNGTKYEVGDIVSVLDVDGGVYYALIRGFLQDHHANRHAVITWLLPTHPNPTHFDPTRFILGPEEDTPMCLSLIEFVCHSPRSKNFQASFIHNIELASLWESA